MRDTEHFKNHLSIVTEIDDKTISVVPVEDPFHTTNVVHEMEWSLWDWLKMLFVRKETVRIRVKVRSDGVAQGRWFRGADICEKCQSKRIDGPGQNEFKPGYESHGMRVCENCYYGKWDGEMQGQYCRVACNAEAQ